jgi:hypothetical protein
MPDLQQVVKCLETEAGQHERLGLNIDQRIAYWKKKGLSEEEAMARGGLDSREIASCGG